MDIADLEQSLTPEEVARILRVKPATVRYWLRNGKLDGFNVGFTWRIPLSALTARIRKAGS